jgi:hypothetical protein
MRTNHPHTKRVYQYDLDRLTLISQFDSIRQAAEFVGLGCIIDFLWLPKGRIVV